MPETVAIVRCSQGHDVPLFEQVLRDGTPVVQPIYFGADKVWCCGWRTVASDIGSSREGS